MPHPNGADTDPEWVRVGETVRALRMAWDLSQVELAIRAGIERTMLARVELGRRRLPAASARRIAAVLAVRPIAILSPVHFQDEHATSLRAGIESTGGPRTPTHRHVRTHPAPATLLDAVAAAAYAENAARDEARAAARAANWQAVAPAAEVAGVPTDDDLVAS